MKIAILAGPLDNQSAGVHTYTKGLIEALLQYDSNNEYVLIREKKGPDLPSKVQQVIIPNLPFLPLFASLRLFVIVPLILRRLQVDAVVEPAHFGPFNLPRHVRRITVIHDLTPLLFPQYHRWHSQLLQRLMLRRILKKAHLILAVSQNTAHDLASHFPFTEPKTVVVPPGRDPFFRPAPSKAVLKKWRIDAPYFLFVGTIEPRKNLLLLLRAYRQFREQYKERVLLLIVGGKGWKYRVFYDELAQHPYRQDIHLTGYVDKQDLPAFYTHALALVYPSLYEGFGLPVLEAMACGAVVICSSRSSLPEVGGTAALYFGPEDEAGLLRNMQAIVQNELLAEEKKALSLQQAAAFSWESYVRLFIEAIQASNSTPGPNRKQ
ncbi:MAG: glycosyltransferase family 4 protein [Phaeodactylibacter sp.]|nr:glycosyltransferase family 4 protein [Phaeodactylibacter sp.]MCB0596469.1 glycosyltransferase family 4 protein [Phaeodactylibacter sp.]